MTKRKTSGVKGKSPKKRVRKEAAPNKPRNRGPSHADHKKGLKRARWWGEDRDQVFKKKRSNPDYNQWRVKKSKFKDPKLGPNGGPRYCPTLFFDDPMREQIPFEQIARFVSEGAGIGATDEIIGWHHLEAAQCAMVLAKYGAGQPEIVGYHCPGKIQAQLNCMMQKIYGQQSMAANSDIRTHPYTVWLRNATDRTLHRKNGVVVHTGKAHSTVEKKLNKVWFKENQVLCNFKIPVVEERGKNYSKCCIKAYRMEYLIREEMDRRDLKVDPRLEYTGRKIYFEKWLKPFPKIPTIANWKFKEEFKAPMKQDNPWSNIRISENYNLLLRDQATHCAFLNGWAFDCYNDYPEIHDEFDSLPCLARVDQFKYFKHPFKDFDLRPDAVPVFNNKHFDDAGRTAEKERKKLCKGPDPILVQKTREQFDKDKKAGKYKSFKQSGTRPTTKVRAVIDEYKEKARRAKEKKTIQMKRALGQEVENKKKNMDPKFRQFERVVEFEKADPGNVLRNMYGDIDLELAEKIVKKGDWKPFTVEIAAMQKRNETKFGGLPSKPMKIKKSNVPKELKKKSGKKKPEKNVEKKKPAKKKAKVKKAEKKKVKKVVTIAEPEEDDTSTFSETAVQRWTNKDLVDYLESKDFPEAVVNKVRASSIEGKECFNLSEDMADNIFGPSLPKYDAVIMKAIRQFGYN